jgi:nucleoside-diphosphate-sugar epimerase
MKNYLLTGSTGFVGRNILVNLLKKNISLSVVVRKKNQHKLNEFPSIKNVFYTDNLFLESKDWWRKVCQNIDVVIHAAWYTQHDD